MFECSKSFNAPDGWSIICLRSRTEQSVHIHGFSIRETYLDRCVQPRAHIRREALILTSGGGLPKRLAHEGLSSRIEAGLTVRRAMSQIRHPGVPIGQKAEICARRMEESLHKRGSRMVRYYRGCRKSDIALIRVDS